MMDVDQQFSQAAHPPARRINPRQRGQERPSAALSADDERYSNNNDFKFSESSNGDRNCSAPTTPTTRKANEILKSRRRQQHASIITPTKLNFKSDDAIDKRHERKQPAANAHKQRHHLKQTRSTQQHQHERNDDEELNSTLQQHRYPSKSKVKEEHNGRKYKKKGAANRSRTRNRGHSPDNNIPSKNNNRRGSKSVDDVSREVHNNNANTLESTLDRQNKMKTNREDKQRQHPKKTSDRNRLQQSRRRNDNRIAIHTSLSRKDDDCVNANDHCDNEHPKLEAENCIINEHQSNDDESTQSQSSPSPLIRSEEELRMQRRSGIKVQTLLSCNEEEGCENIECKLSYEEITPDNLYQYHFSNRLINKDDNGTNEVDDAVESGDNDNSHQDTNSEVNAVGKNGWHRMLELLSSHDNPPTSSASANGDEHSFENNGQKRVVNILANNDCAPLSEKQALQDEYEKLQREIGSIERDRLALEREFHEIEVKKRSQARNHWIVGDRCDNERSYHDFRNRLHNMKEDDLMSIPSMLWKEDVQLDHPKMIQQHNRRRRDNNRGDRGHKKKHYNDVTSRIDPKFRTVVQEHRGIGMAVLIADTECHDALIKHCRKQSRQRRKASETFDGEATLIREGGKYVRYCGITGQTKQSRGNKSGTSYFIKFDGGKSHHHGFLPSNLSHRLEREKKSVKSIRYLSTGPLMACSPAESDKEGVRSYYLEFDSGECWWNVPACNNEYDHYLERVFRDVDVHRVAFGRFSDSVTSTSWVVISKDGSVFYRNVPEGLHDFLTTRRAEKSHIAPCEVSLGISGSYFIRFLDGCADYNLPKFTAVTLEKLEAQGSCIRSVSLHIDSADCLIRFQ